MPNRLYNKQVTPKGYKMGGRTGKMGGGMMMKRPMMQEGGEIKPPKDPNRKRPKALRDLKEEPMRDRKKDYKIGTKFQGDYKGKSLPGKAKEFFKTAGKQAIGTAKKIGKKFRTKKMGGGIMMKRPMMKKGGSLKPVNPQTQKGLSKLPTEVRNKMGYMKKGGKVNGK